MSKRRLLLADDSVTIQKVVTLTFVEEGIEVITAGDGNTAMEKFVEATPDLVMVDVNMPGLDGYRICEMIKQDDETKHIPVILLVGSFEPFDEAEARRVGADDYLTKPFQSIRQLVSRVSNLLNHVSGENSIYNQTGIASANLENGISPNRFESASETVNNIDFTSFEGLEADDDIIQTSQIGSLPADETQKFISDANQQPAEDFLASPSSEQTKEYSAETQPLSIGNFEAAQRFSAEAEISPIDERFFEFADNQPYSPKNQTGVSEQKTPQSNESYKNMTSDAKIDTAPKSEDDFDFDLDDLNFLELPPVAKKLPPKAEQSAPALAKNTGNLDTKPTDKNEAANDSVEIVETKAPAEVEVRKDATEIPEFSPEIIEAITKRIMEKLSDKVVKEIAREFTPQMTESIIKEMARNKTN